MELLQVLTAAKDVGLTALVVVVFFYLWRSRAAETHEQTTVTAGLVGLLADTSANIKACTEAIIDLKSCEDETQSLVTGFRREVQQAHGGQLELLGELKTALDRVPALTAEEVETRVKPSFEHIQNALAAAATGLLSANNQIEQLATWLRLRAEPISAEYGGPSAGETVNDLATTKGDSDGNQSTSLGSA